MKQYLNKQLFEGKFFVICLGSQFSITFVCLVKGTPTLNMTFCANILFPIWLPIQQKFKILIAKFEFAKFSFFFFGC